MYDQTYSQIYPYISWSKYYNAPSNLQDSAVAIVKNSSGMLFVTGWSLGSTTNKDIAVLRYNPETGDTVWVKRFVGANEDNPAALAVDNNAAYITGYWFNGFFRDVITIKFNAANGDTTWVRKFNGPINGGDYGKAITVDNNGNVYVCGRTDVGGAQKYLILKYSSAGALDTFIYRDPILSTIFDEAHSIVCDNSGSNVYVTGTSGIGTAADVLTLKVSTSSPMSLVWAKKHTGPGAIEDNGIVARLDNSQANLFVGGWGRTAVQDYFVIKYNSANGDSLAFVTYNGPTFGSDALVGMVVDPGNNVIVTGSSSNSPVNRFEYATVKYNSGLVQQWVARTTNPDGDDKPSSLTIGSGNDLYVTGYRVKAGQGANYFTIRYNLSNGDTIWTKMENGISNVSDYASGVTVIDSERVFITGSAVSGSTSMYTLRYMNQIVGIKPISTEIPAKFNLDQNYPNPFNPSTSIRFDIAKASIVKITVFDVTGREVEVIANENVKPGKYEATWDASKYSSGVYFYQLSAGEFTDTKKMILSK
jgi:hypothetical protein